MLKILDSPTVKNLKNFKFHHFTFCHKVDICAFSSLEAAGKGKKNWGQHGSADPQTKPEKGRQLHDPAADPGGGDQSATAGRPPRARKWRPQFRPAASSEGQHHALRGQSATRSQLWSAAGAKARCGHAAAQSNWGASSGERRRAQLGRQRCRPVSPWVSVAVAGKETRGSGRRRLSQAYGAIELS